MSSKSAYKERLYNSIVRWAINSWITSAKVSTYDGYASTIAWKQATLVSGTNIKTVNNNSLLGSWNLTLNDVKVSSTAPASPTEWMVWYDTTNDVLKTYNWTGWDEAWGWGDVMVSSQSWNILTSWMKIWAWSQSDYNGLGTYDSNTVYLTI